VTDPTHLSVATFNVHCGVDGWGRPFDVVAECAALDADVLVMQESWTPADGGLSTAATVGRDLGYQLYEEQLSTGRIFPPHPSANHRWGPRPRSASVVFRLDNPHRPRSRNFDRLHPEFSLGTFGLAVLTRVPVTRREVIPLGRLKTDASRRLAIASTVPVGDGSMTVIGTHMSHLLQRSPVQYARLRNSLPDPESFAAVLTGDMNMWGPPLGAFFRGWRRVIRGRTWPAFRPHSQLDHMLVTPSVALVDARIAEATRSDHLPVRVTVALARAPVGGANRADGPGVHRQRS
jgi:endonuclease/exonuclease/phosphatase family metal-dependent hydrolase